MKKILFVFLAVVFASSLCFCMGSVPAPSAPSSLYTDQATKIVTGEVASFSFENLNGTRTSVVRLNVLDDNKNATTVDLQLGTTASWPSPKDKRFEVIYFAAQDGRNVALSVRDLTTTK
jgi:hypothetical protein